MVILYHPPVPFVDALLMKPTQPPAVVRALILLGQEGCIAPCPLDRKRADEPR